jgi:hypothetical protein
VNLAKRRVLIRPDDRDEEEGSDEADVSRPLIGETASPHLSLDGVIDASLEADPDAMSDAEWCTFRLQIPMQYRAARSDAGQCIGAGRLSYLASSRAGRQRDGQFRSAEATPR